MDQQDEKLNKIIEAVHDIKDTLTEQKVTLAKQAVVLEDHTRRSLAAEENLDLLRQQIKPIENHVAFMRGVGKTILMIITAMGAIATVFKVLH